MGFSRLPVVAAPSWSKSLCFQRRFSSGGKLFFFLDEEESSSSGHADLTVGFQVFQSFQFPQLLFSLTEDQTRDFPDVTV